MPTPNGLYKFGDKGWRQDGTDAQRIDGNTDAVDSALTEIKTTVETIVETGLPPLIDGGTF